MVREVGVRTGVIERELTADEQRALMVRGREGSAEGRTGLTIGHKRVGKEQAGLGCKSVGNLTGLTHKAVLHLHTVIDRTTVTDNRVLADHARTDKHRGVHRTHHGTLRESGSTTDLAVTFDDGVGDILGIDNLHVVTDIAAVRTCHSQLVLNHLLQGLSQVLVGVMLHHKRGQLTVQLAEDGHVTVTHLVQYRDDRSLTIGGIIGGLKGTDIRDITVVTYRIVVDVVAYLLYQTVVTHGHVSQGGVVDTRVFEESFAHLHHLVESTQTDIAIEYHAMEVIRFKVLVD